MVAAPTSMRTFMKIWVGQTVSRFGTYMTAYTLFNFWVWEQTGRATEIALVDFTGVIGAVLALFFGGALVDRFNRKRIMIAADALAAFGTLAYLILYLNGSLQIWHLAIGSIFTFFFGELHGLAFISATTLIVPRDQYSRAGSLRFLTHYGALILSPPLAAILYKSVGLPAILLFDMVTVGAAVLTVAFIQIPQPPETAAGRESRQHPITEIIYGFRYIWRSPSLRTFVLLMGLFSFAHDAGESVHTAMILGRTANDFGLVSLVGTAAGLGGLAGAILMTTWGGPKRKIRAWLLGTMGAGLAKLTFSLGRGGSIWLPAQFGSSFNFPVRGGSKEAILLAKVEPDVQGRYFGAEQIVVFVLGGIARLIAGPLSDGFLVPAMLPGGVLAGVLGGVFGTGPGVGYSVLYFCTSFSMIVIGLSGWFLPALRQIEERLPDHDAAAQAAALEPALEVSAA
ncbi:MAG: MFS transporter [Anaerolineae bacterium]|nr:MFS transporter [Anaerolineae bacterium]